VPELFGQNYSSRDLDERIGRAQQLAGIRPFEFSDGRARGVRAFDVRTGAGLSFTCVADRALDICSAEYRGIPLAWHAPAGVAAPTYYQSQPEDFERNFFGGLFTTCGLANFGPAGSDAYGSFGMHGRVNHLPAHDVCARTIRDADTSIFEISGTVSESQMFGESVRLDRRLHVTLGTNRLTLRDTVTNEGGTRRPHMLLYHCNMGFPLLDIGSQLHLSQKAMRPRDAQAQLGLREWNRGGPPDPQFAEQVFIHEPAARDGRARAMMVNRELDDGRGVALMITYDIAQLPALFTWRMLGVKTYVMGIEPANCLTIEGRVQAGKDGTLPFLAPAESRSYDISFDVFNGPEQIDAALASL
jgi:hypothetical protein